MTTAARQQRILANIERTLRRTDPRLASKFGMFSQLAQDEQMPPAEQTTSRPAGWRSRMPRIGQLPRRLRVAFRIAGGDRGGRSGARSAGHAAGLR
jgi:hypothetical protein